MLHVPYIYITIVNHHVECVWIIVLTHLHFIVVVVVNRGSQQVLVLRIAAFVKKRGKGDTFQTCLCHLLPDRIGLQKNEDTSHASIFLSVNLSDLLDRIKKVARLCCRRTHIGFGIEKLFLNLLRQYFSNDSLELAKNELR
jgi:hypothetical protein